MPKAPDWSTGLRGAADVWGPDNVWEWDVGRPTSSVGYARSR